MKLISERQLAAMRSCAALAFGDRCTVRRRTSAIDSLGSDVPVWVIYSSVPCKLTPDRLENHSTEGEQFGVHGGWSIALPFDQAVSSGDEIVHDGATYTVLKVEESPTWHTLRRASLRRVD